MNLLDFILSIILHMTPSDHEVTISPAPTSETSLPTPVEPVEEPDFTPLPEPEGEWNDGEPIVCEEGWTFVEDGDKDYCELSDYDSGGPASQAPSDEAMAELMAN